MADILGFESQGKPTIFQAAKGTFSLADTVSLIQSYTITYQQQLQPIYEVGSSNIYYSRTHQAGQLQIRRMLSDGSIYNYWGNGCNAENATITAASGICGGGTKGVSEITLVNTLLQGFTLEAQAGQAHVTEGVTVFFTNLEMK